MLDGKLLDKWRVDDEKREDTLELDLSVVIQQSARKVFHILPENMTLKFVSANTFVDMYKMRKLNLSFNWLSSSWEESGLRDALAPLRGLQELCLTGNRLASLDFDVIKTSLGKLKRLYVDSNQIEAFIINNRLG